MAIGTLSAGWRTRVWNGTTGYLQVTSDGQTYKMYADEEREFYLDPVASRIASSQSSRRMAVSCREER